MVAEKSRPNLVPRHGTLLDTLNHGENLSACNLVGLIRIQIKLKGDVLDCTVKMNRASDRLLIRLDKLATENAFYQHIPVLLDSSHKGFTVSTRIRNRKLLLNLHVGEATNIERLVLNLGGVRAILAIGKLDNCARRITYRLVMLGHQVLHRLYKLTLEITRISRLNGCINQTFTTRHSVKECLCWSQALNE